jgi:23S rRNA pseudouridine2605 synthase
MADGVRIQKALADAGVASRRAAEELVSEGRVTVNGEPAQIGQRVIPGQDRITVNGRVVGPNQARVYLAMHKPAGVTSTVSDRHAEQTVVELVPRDIREAAGRIYPVGRLDLDSEGLLLLTNDGEWAQRMLHPRFGVEREYAVGLAVPITVDQVRALEQGIELEEGRALLLGLRPATGAEVARLAGVATTGFRGDRQAPLHWYRAILGQGWRRQIRRMFTAVGAPVSRLVRVRIGPLRLAGMPVGEVRELTGAERRAMEAASQDPGRSTQGKPATRTPSNRSSR